MAAKVPPSSQAKPRLQNLFKKCVSCVLQSWSALRLAVENELGGHDSKEKAVWLEDVMSQLFLDNGHLEWLDVEEYLEEIINAEYNLLVQDGSLAQVAKQLCQFYQLCCQGNERLVEEAMQAQLKLPQRKIGEGKSLGEGSESDDDDDEDFDESSSMMGGVSKGKEGKLKEQEVVPGLLVAPEPSQELLKPVSNQGGMLNQEGLNKGLESLCIQSELTDPDPDTIGSGNVENESGNMDSEWTVVSHKKGKKK